MKYHLAKWYLKSNEVPPPEEPEKGVMLMLLQTPEVFSCLFVAEELGGRN